MIGRRHITRMQRSRHRAVTLEPEDRLVIVTLVAANITEDVLRIAADLRRDAMQIETATADILRLPASGGVFVFCLDAVHARALAAPISTWVGKSERPCALIGVVPDGSG